WRDDRLGFTENAVSGCRAHPDIMKTEWITPVWAVTAPDSDPGPSRPRPEPAHDSAGGVAPTNQQRAQSRHLTHPAYGRTRLVDLLDLVGKIHSDS
ncbi:hypothetical protein, partial [Micromonospora sp. NPDC005171]|uniref:hypothetical protein n=1 Tax=Micromonospora sp. NPDC005171 TaxID=3156866 RepID=UPI0033B397AA